MSKTSTLGGVIMLLGFCVCGAQRITTTADFESGRNTNGWMVSDTTWKSPVYPAPVEGFTLSGTNLSENAAFSIAYSGGAFTISATDAARLTSFTANYTVTRLETPSNLMITNVVDSCLRVAWSPVMDATGYLLELCTNHLDGVSAGTPLFAEGFSHVPGKGNSTPLDADTFAALTDTRAGWSFDTCYYGILPTTNAVQIGNTSNPGHLDLQAPTQVLGKDGCTLEISARRFSATTAPDMPVTRVTANGETNLLGVLTLTEDLTSRYLDLPALADGDTLCFHSATNKKDGRIVLEGIRILQDYSAGTLVYDPFTSTMTTDTFCDFRDLPLAEIAVCVTALADDAKDNSEPSAYATVDLADPPRMHVLRAFPLSSCEDGVYAEDFGGLSNITARTSWYNGIWPLPYWMGYNDRDEPVGTIGVAAPTTTTSGFFSFVPANRLDRDRALGFRGSSDREFHYGIAFVNDTGAPRNNFRLSYEGVQWNHKNASAMTNTFEYLVTNELVGVSTPGNWVSVPELDFAPPCTSTAYSDVDEWWGGLQSAALAGVTLGMGQYLIIRWTDDRSQSSGGVGVSKFRLASERVPLTSCIIIR